MRRLRRSGLRWKLVLALVLTSAATLAAAVLALVPPLEHRIASDRLGEMRDLAGTAGLDLRRLPAHDLRRRSPRLGRIVLALQRRTGGRVALYTASGALLKDTDPARGEPPGEEALDRVPAAEATPGSAMREAVRGGEAIVVSDVGTHAGPVTLVLSKPLNDSRAAVAVMRGGLPLAAMAGLTIALLLGIALSYGLLHRLERLRPGARRLREGGVGEPPPPGRRPAPAGAVPPTPPRSTGAATRSATCPARSRRCARACRPRSARARRSSAPRRTSCARRWRCCRRRSS